MPRYHFRTRVQPGKLELYKLHHRQVWASVEERLRAAGVTLLTIWGPSTTPQSRWAHSDGTGSSESQTQELPLLDDPCFNVLQMFIETADGVDLGKVTGPGTDSYVPEWEELMQSFFEGGVQWVPMEELYTLTPTTSTNAKGDEKEKIRQRILTLEAELAAAKAEDEPTQQ